MPGKPVGIHNGVEGLLGDAAILKKGIDILVGDMKRLLIGLLRRERFQVGCGHFIYERFRSTQVEEWTFDHLVSDSGVIIPVSRMMTLGKDRDEPQRLRNFPFVLYLAI